LPREIYTLWKIISTDNYDNHFKAITTAMGWEKSPKTINTLTAHQMMSILKFPRGSFLVREIGSQI